MSEVPNTDEQAGGAEAQVAQETQVAAESPAPDAPQPRMFVNPEVRAALDAAGLTTEDAGEPSQEELNEYMEKSVAEAVSTTPLEDTGPEQQLAAAIKGFISAAPVRYESLFTGQANTQAEILRVLGEAEILLRQHIIQLSTTEESND